MSLSTNAYAYVPAKATQKHESDPSTFIVSSPSKAVPVFTRRPVSRCTGVRYEYECSSSAKRKSSRRRRRRAAPPPPPPPLREPEVLRRGDLGLEVDVEQHLDAAVEQPLEQREAPARRQVDDGAARLPRPPRPHRRSPSASGSDREDAVGLVDDAEAIVVPDGGAAASSTTRATRARRSAPTRGEGGVEERHEVGVEAAAAGPRPARRRRRRAGAREHEAVDETLGAGRALLVAPAIAPAAAAGRATAGRSSALRRAPSMYSHGLRRLFLACTDAAPELGAERERISISPLRLAATRARTSRGSRPRPCGHDGVPGVGSPSPIPGGTQQQCRGPAELDRQSQRAHTAAAAAERAGWSPTELPH